MVPVTHATAYRVAEEPGLRVVLKGPAGNPDGIGVELRLEDAQGRLGPLESVAAGGGYWSQDAAVRVLGGTNKAVALRVRWPNRPEQRIPLQPSQPLLPSLPLLPLPLSPLSQPSPPLPPSPQSPPLPSLPPSPRSPAPLPFPQSLPFLPSLPFPP